MTPDTEGASLTAEEFRSDPQGLLWRLDREYRARLLEYAEKRGIVRGASVEGAVNRVIERAPRLLAEAPAGADLLPVLLRHLDLCSYEVRREEKGAETPVGPEVLAGAEGRAAHPDGDGTEERERATRLHRSLWYLMTLPPSQRRVLVLRAFGGLRYKQIAEIAGESVSNVGVLLLRARKSLLARVRDGGREP